jgi:glucose-6-phosphate 1-dehydrogenase
MTARPRKSAPNGFAFVLIGGTGDLAMRTILPALYAAHRDGALEEGGPAGPRKRAERNRTCPAHSECVGQLA